MKNKEIYDEASKMLAELYGRGAEFREGQYEAIEATMMNRRTLVVQRTGWGKSLVYFIATKLLRERGQGVTVVVSPLLVLMQNQMEAADKLGLKCEVLNSRVKDRKAEIVEKMVRDELDLVFITPETLFSIEVQNRLKDIRIGLFVVDEAHCISDWGHDFRLEYGNLRDVIQQLPENVPLLATTATANDRVVKDLMRQFGDGVFLSKGSLMRESLALQVLNLPSRVERYAWILENISKLEGSGLIYCMTTRDCDNLADFLRENGVEVRAYHAGRSEEECAEAEYLFKHNRVKALVATIKLGMGYDKDDIAFVIHYQMPANIVSYYQQIGRAGRKLPRAYAFLCCGEEDQKIINYFIDTAFPSEKETTDVYRLILDSDGVTTTDMAGNFNYKNQKIEKILSFLINDGFVRMERSPKRYYATPKKYYYDAEKYNAISNVRRQEMKQMFDIVNTDECLSRYVVAALNDETATDCHNCANCLGEEILPSSVSEEFLEKAKDFVERALIEIKPRKMWPTKEFTGTLRIGHQNQYGMCLSKYGEAGYGEMVKEDKYTRGEGFRDALVEKGARVLETLVKKRGVRYITCVPSLRSRIVRDFAEKLAARCGVEFADLIAKTETEPQKAMENSYHQCKNIFEAFYVRDGVRVPEKVILVDDIVDSGWTMTVCGFKLGEAGCEEVYPFALADGKSEGGDN